MFAWKRDQAASVDWHSLLHQMPADVLILELSTGLVCFFALPWSFCLWSCDPLSIFPLLRAWGKSRSEAHCAFAKLYGEREDDEGSSRGAALVVWALNNYSTGCSQETLDNLARSRLARSCVHVVLAMEVRCSKRSLDISWKQSRRAKTKWIVPESSKPQEPLKRKTSRLHDRQEKGKLVGTKQSE